MINAIVNGLFSVLQGLIAVVLAPIDLILGNIPALNELADGVANFKNIIANAIPWAFDFIPPATKVAIATWILAMLFFWNAQRTVSLIKMTYNWIQKIKFW